MKAIKFLSHTILLSIMISCLNSRKIPVLKNEKTDSLLETQYVKMFTDATKDVLLYNYYKGAIPLYNSCIDQFPERSAPYYQLSSIYMKLGNIELATENAEKALSLDSLNIWYMFHLANIYQFNKNYDKALNVYERIREIRENDEILYNMAALYNLDKRNDKALDVLNRMQRKNTESKEVIVMKHTIYNQMRNYDSAIYELEKLPLIFPEDISGYGILAEYLTELGRRNYAKGIYKKMLEIDSTNGIALLSFGEFYLRENMPDSAFYYFRKAYCCSDLSLEEKINVAIGYINNSEFIAKYYINIDELLEEIIKEERDFEYYAAKSDLFINVEKYENAKLYMDSALLYEKNNYMLWEQSILINSYLNRNEDVVKLSTECLKYFRDKANIYYFRANAYYNLDMLEPAVIDIDSILKMETEENLRVQALILEAEIFRKQNEFEKSDILFEEILKIVPENLMVRNNYAYYLSLRNLNLKRAEVLSKLTIEKEPFNATYLDTYGWIMFKSGNYKEARYYIEAAIRYGAYNNAEVLEHYGDIMMELSNCMEALEAYEKAKELIDTESIKNKIVVTKEKCK